MENVEGRCVYEFGDFRVDAAQRLLLLKADGRPLPLVSRAFDTLLYFVQHHGELLDRATLMKAVWPNAIVEENNLNQSIAAIRRVLGETPNEHKFIVTVPGRGYRFVAQVKTITALPSGAGTTAVQVDAPPPRDEMLAPKVPADTLPVDLPIDISPPRSDALRTRKRTLTYAFGFLLLAALSYYAIDRVLLSSRPATSTATRSAIERSIAVLPFENRGEDSANAYIAEGVQDEILTLLSKIGALKVISRTSTDHYANAPANLPEIARQLGVTHILEGSVQKLGDRVRINVQLIDAAADNQLWAETYERKLIDVFAIESEVARAIADTLQAKLTGAEQRELAVRPTQNPQAYDAYLRELAYSLRTTRTEAEVRDGIAALEEAVRLDPGFTVAWAQLARKHAILVINSYDLSPYRREAARQAVEAAVRLRPDLVETQLALGSYRYRIEDDYEGAEQIFAQVRQKLPNNAYAAYGLSNIAWARGRRQESFALFQEVLLLDPRNAFRWEILCERYMSIRQFAVALKACDGALNLLPGNAGVLSTKATIYQGLGEIERADAMLAGLQPVPGNARVLRTLSYQAMLQHRYPATIVLLQSYLASPEARDSQIGKTRRWLGDLQRLEGDAVRAKASYLQARDELQMALKAQPANSDLIAELALVYAGLQEKQAALKYAEQALALGQKSKHAPVARIEETQARIEARFGDNDHAIAALQHLLTVPGGSPQPGSSPPLTPALLRLDPDFDGLRADPRFQQLVAEGGTGKP